MQFEISQVSFRSERLLLNEKSPLFLTAKNRIHSFLTLQNWIEIYLSKILNTSGHILNCNFKFQVFEFIILLNIQFNILNVFSINLNIKTFNIFYMI